MAKTPTYLTSTALETLKGELFFLKKEKRSEVSERIAQARDMGDLSENAEYEAALDEQALLENRISYIESTLRNAKIIKEESGFSEVVLGATVLVDMNGKKDEFMLVGKVEANPLKKKISDESPLGKVLIGSKIGEVKIVVTPQVSYQVKVLEIK